MKVSDMQPGSFYDVVVKDYDGEPDLEFDHLEFIGVAKHEHGSRILFRTSDLNHEVEVEFEERMIRGVRVFGAPADLRLLHGDT